MSDEKEVIESQVLDYERLPADLWFNVWRREGEFLLQRRPYRWTLNGNAIPNAYEMFSMDAICEGNDLEIVCTYGDSLAIVRKKQQP